MSEKYKIGYTQGVYDMFHKGHLNLLNNAKKQCEYLIVGVNSDALVQNYKRKTPVISEADRAYIVENIKAVDECVIVNTLDKEILFKEMHFDAIFIGDDWKESPRWIETKKIMSEKYGVDVVFLKHTDGISSTVLRPLVNDQVKE